MAGEVRQYLSAESQRALASKAQRGDQAAFGVLYEHFVEALTGYVSGRLSSEEDVRDMVADTFATALKLLSDGRYDPQYTVYTFLKVIADSQISHHLRGTHVEIRAQDDSQAPRYVHRLRPLADIPEISCLPAQEVELAAYELLLLVLSCGAKPHHTLAFCFIGFFDWRPREVVEQLGARSLFALARRVYDDFASQSLRRSPHRMICRDHCPQFWQKLVAPVGVVYPEQEYRHLGAHSGPVGDLTLSAFLGQRPSASLSDWCYKVRTRARKALDVGIFPMEEHHAPRS